MAEHRVLLDAFADARRSWDDLAVLKLDVMAGSNNLKKADLVALARRLNAHREAIGMLASALETEPADTNAEGSALAQRTGISNRESARDEGSERTQPPPLATDSPPPQRAGGPGGD